MKRTQDRIKDFVEPQAYDEVRDFASDAARALAAYRFTEATSDLLARWLDTLSDLPHGRGGARALAGMRGVGKSHLLTVFAALVSTPALRPAVADAHVATSARRLTSRRHTVVRVERGTHTTFAAELAAAFAKQFGGNESEWALDPVGALAKAVERARGTTLVLIIDTAYGRPARVSRDDGPHLGALAEATRERDVFLALALDDDISGAEGPNVAIARAFQIDYLEPDHLYQVANAYLLRKSPVARERLHEIYTTLRSSVPNFNWSEPRFAALYPVHPVVADVAAAVRLHAHAFAFLPFAASAAARAVNRPALSLILLDEVFDQTEKELREAKELHETFAVYDELAAKAVAQFPALQRLHVRLVLKNLFVLSLDGRGAAARDLCAAMLAADESSPQAVVGRLEEILRRLVELAPRGGLLCGEDGAGPCYRFHLDANAGFEEALSRAVNLPLADPRPVQALLAGLARARFEDWPLADSQAATEGNAKKLETVTTAPFSVEWRGTSRPGRLFGPADDMAAPTEADEFCDWELFVLPPAASGAEFAERLSASRQAKGGTDEISAPVAVVWQPAELTAEEWNLLRRLHALRADPSLAGYGDAAHAAASTLGARAARVWTRLYVDDGELFIGSERFRFDEEARARATLAGVLGEALAPSLATRFPQHPQFSAVLCEQAVEQLVEKFFGGADAAGAQQLAEQFARPLGLAVMRGEALAPAAGESLLAAPWVREVLTQMEVAGGEVVPLAALGRALAATPYGLRRDAQQLVLAALVAARRVDLVTTTGVTVNRLAFGRALDWSQVAGVCRPAGAHLGAQELTEWARHLTGKAELPLISDGVGREEVGRALVDWLTAWTARSVLTRFDALPDAGLTTRAARLAISVRSTFGAAVAAVESGLASGASLEEILQRVADSFGTSPENFTRAAEELEALTVYTDGIARRESITDYLTLADATGIEEIESARRELLNIADDPHTLFDVDSRDRFELLWRAFRERYCLLYIEAHARTAGAHAERDADERRPLEALLCSEAWLEFEALAQLSFVNPRPWREARALVERASGRRCTLSVAELIADHPRCACGFRLSEAEELPDAVARLEELVARGRALYRRTLRHFHAHLARALEGLTHGEAREERTEVVARVRTLANSFALGQNPARITSADVSLLVRALARSPAPPPLVRLAPPDARGLLTSAEVAARWQQWAEELPDGPALVEIVSESEDGVSADASR